MVSMIREPVLLANAFRGRESKGIRRKTRYKSDNKSVGGKRLLKAKPVQN